MRPLHAAKKHRADYQPAISYEPLPIEITQNGGHHYRQKWRDDYAAVYEQRNPFGAFLGYEAIVIKRQEQCRVFGRHYPAKELYPCSEDWGKRAISTSDLDRAMDAAREFSRRESLKTHRKAADSSRIRQARRVKGPSRLRTRVERKANEPEPIQ